MRGILLLFLIWGLGQTANAQTGAIKGEIWADGESIIGATISIKGTTSGVASDVEGKFLLENVPVGTYTLLIRSIGYRNQEQEVTVKANETLQIDQVELVVDALGLDEVVVTGTMEEISISRSPIKVDVISAKYFETTISPTNITEAVQLVNGVDEVVACGVCFTNSISINGLPGAYTAVLVDGSPIFGNLASVYGLNGISTAVIDRFEVIKGPSSTLYGSEAVAGVINIITKNPKDQPILSVDLMGTSHQESFGNIGLAPRIGKLNGMIGINYAYINDFDDENGDGFGDNINLDRIGLFSKWSLERASRKRFVLSAKYYYEDRRNGVEAFLTDRAYRDLRGSEEIYGESIYTNRAELFGTYEFNTSENLRIDYSFSHHIQDSYYGSDGYSAEQTIGFANLVWSKQIKKHSLTLGATSRIINYDDNTVATQRIIDGEEINNPSKQFIPGVFAQDEWNFTDKLTVLTGARLDHYENHGAIFAPRVNVKYAPWTYTTIRANFGTGFRIVNLFTEDHAFVSSNREIVIAEELDPESSYNASLNLNHVYNLGNGQGMLDINAYYTYFTNAIFPNYDEPGKIVYANSDGFAVSKGIGANINHQFSFPLSVNVGFNLQEVTRTEADDTGVEISEPIEFAARWSGVGTANWTLKKANMSIAYTFRITGPMALPEVFDVDENGDLKLNPRSTTSKPFANHNIQFNKAFKNKSYSLYLGVQNLFNYRQEESPLVGFNDPNASAGFSQNFDTSYAYSPLHGREVYVGIRWSLARKS